MLPKILTAHYIRLSDLLNPEEIAFLSGSDSMTWGTNQHSLVDAETFLHEIPRFIEDTESVAAITQTVVDVMLHPDSTRAAIYIDLEN